MAKQIVIATHALLARGFEEALRLIYNPADNVHVICGFTEAPNPGEAFDEIFAAFSEDDIVIVMTDLVGGSVNNQIAERLRDKKFFLISGINLAVLLELACCSEQDLNEDYIRKVVALGKENLVFINDKLKENTQDQSEDSFL